MSQIIRHVSCFTRFVLWFVTPVMKTGLGCVGIWISWANNCFEGEVTFIRLWLACFVWFLILEYESEQYFWDEYSMEAFIQQICCAFQTNVWKSEFFQDDTINVLKQFGSMNNLYLFTNMLYYSGDKKYTHPITMIIFSDVKIRDHDK